MTPSRKPEVVNATPSGEDEAWPQATHRKSLVKFGCAVFDLRERTDRQTDRQTNGHTRHNTTNRTNGV